MTLFVYLLYLTIWCRLYWIRKLQIHIVWSFVVFVSDIEQGYGCAACLLLNVPTEFYRGQLSEENLKKNFLSKMIF